MKIRKFLFVAAATVLAASAFFQKQQEQRDTATDTWKPVDPLQPFSKRDDE
jgi:hypothetical protein